jgi:hypothetical protein
VRALAVAALVLVAAFVLADEGRVQRDVRTKHFQTAVVCKACHSNAEDSGAMRDHQGRGISPYDLWVGTMMANSARDPLFRATVAAEAKAAGKARAEVEAGCLHCHAPMASVEYGPIALAQLDNEDEEDDWDIAALARDGVSCTLCHQIKPGAKPGGKFEVNDEREIYGPFDQQFGLAMHRVSKYWPVQGKHMLDSEHCGTCHASSVPGETTHLEWRNSTREKTCQDCHMPKAGRTRIARTSHGGDIKNLPARSPIGRHFFAGGNTLVPRILRDNPDALHVKAPAEAFDAAIAASRQLLREETARISIREAAREGDKLYIVVDVENLTGHKFPTGHASRRAWLRLRVRDSKGRVVFASGGTDAQGRLLGGPGVHAAEAAGGPVLPHYAQITRPEEVQVYEAVPKGSYILTHGRTALRKDNRLLPKGYSAKHAEAEATRPVGVGDDEDFAAGGDAVVYMVPFPEGELPYTIEAELLYQPVSPRYAAELFRIDHAEIARFRQMYEAAGNPPEVVARAKLVVGF